VAYLMETVVFQHRRKKRKYSKGTLDIRAENWSNMYWSLPGNVVSISTAYGLDGPGIESLWGRDFPHLSRPALRPTQHPVQWVPGISRG
jgi:hypothetical protein